MPDGTCEDCKQYTRSQEDGKVCDQDACEDNQKVLPSGKCEDCLEYTRLSDNKLTCEPDICNYR